MGQLHFGFIGLGLIGGSIAKAVRARIPHSYITAYDVLPEALELARREHTADRTVDAVDGSFSNCDYIFLCAPVQKNEENLARVSPFLSPDCILTDVGSVKTNIHEAAARAGLESRFIGGHPMAGSERTGYVNSKALLLENAYYILTPSHTVPQKRVAEFQELVARLGSLPLVLDYKTHDYVTAAVSHLPHVIASSLVNLVREHDSAEGVMKMIAAGGFKDITRIASSSPGMWQQICLTNTENISRLLSDYIDSLKLFQAALDRRDKQALYGQFESARIYRDSFIDSSGGPIKRSYSLSIDIADEPGALASIATILALHQISIKNIGIMHNRESEGGVLRIEFYEEPSIQRAREILQAKGYLTYGTE